jgi:polygalacturonase
VNDVIIKGRKDGIHFGKGKRFKISNAVFQTADDAIALAAGDWVSANPEFGDIEDGVIENCHDIRIDHSVGAFAKVVASAWVDWREGIVLRHGDAVVSNGKVYRVLAAIDGKQYTSVTQPTFSEGMQVLDGIRWTFHGNDPIYTAVVRNVVFRNIHLESGRAFQFVCYSNNYSHSYYKGAPMPIHRNITLDNVSVLDKVKKATILISSPIDVLNVRNSSLRNNSIDFGHSKDFDIYPKTTVNLIGCTFESPEEYALVRNFSPGKEIFLKTSGSVELGEKFAARVEAGPGKIVVNSDLTGLK